MCRHAFLQELRDLEEAENTKYVRSVSKKGALVLNRRLPSHLADELPTELIPKHILRLFALWQRGELQQNKQADVLRYHDTVAALRRYNLIDLPARVRKSSPALKRAYHREYLKGWRAKRRCAAAHADNESAGLVV